VSPLDVPARIPPHNLDAERAVLGAVLLEGRETLPRVIEVLRPSDFYTEAHRVMYGSMLTLFDRGEPVDVLTLTEELRRGDQLEFVGGPAALALLVEQGSISAYLSSYTSIVRDRAVLRELIQTSSQIIAQAFDAKDDVQTLVDDAERRIFSLAERRLEGSALPIGKILRNTSAKSTSPASRPASRSSTSRRRAFSPRTSSSSPADQVWGRRSRWTRRSRRRRDGSVWASSGWEMSSRPSTVVARS
jgi:replicative DNA helicase